MIDENLNLSPIYLNNTDIALNPSYCYSGYRQFENILFFRRVWNDRWQSLVFDFLTNEAFEIDIHWVNFIKFESRTKLIINGLYNDYVNSIWNQTKDIEINFENRNTLNINIGNEILQNENEGEYELYTFGKRTNDTNHIWGKTFSIKLFEKDIIFNCEEIYPEFGLINFFAIYNIMHNKYILLIFPEIGR
jgi:hypothetical protein